MRDPLPHLAPTTFPAIRRARLRTLQVNVGYRCNQSCVHCHVNAGPKRTEEMSRETAELVVRFMAHADVDQLDVTGGAPELNPSFRYLVESAHALGVAAIDRCNLTILQEPGQEDLAEFLAANRVRVVASLPCYLEENVDAQRGKGVYGRSIEGLRALNRIGYGVPGSALELHLVYNPLGPFLPPPQGELERSYRDALRERYGIEFTGLLTMANMPVGRFGSTLLSRGELDGYLGLLRGAHRDANVEGVMCRSHLSVDWRGYTYDCDFNQMLGLGMRVNGSPSAHLSELFGLDLTGRAIAVREHCFGCTAGQGSSCGGALA